MLKKKICMLGAFSVGKTSLVEQYVHSIFSDKYLSTIGVKISKKDLTLNGQDIQLIIWDMEGQDLIWNMEGQDLDKNFGYLRGAMGFFIVADGTHAETVDIALNSRKKALEITGDVPHCILMNKVDLVDLWEIPEERIAALKHEGLKIFRTSAKTREGVEEAFAYLATAIL